MVIQSQDTYDSALLNIEQTAKYLCIGKTKTRELFKLNETVFVVHIGNRKYAHKKLLDEWLNKQARMRC